MNSEINYNIYISGVGGQGIIKTSVIIGEAAMNEGYNVVMSEIHGMSQRGGSVSTELKIGGYKSSIVENSKADMILGFEPIEVLRGLNKSNKDSKIIFNDFPIIPSTLTQTGETYPDIENEMFECDCCSKTKSLAGSVQYKQYRLCNDCVLLAETGFALNKIKEIEDLMQAMEDTRLKELCDYIKADEKAHRN